MCLAIPVRVIAVKNDSAIIDADGVQREVNIALIDKVEIGDYIVVHAGFAIQKWDNDDVTDYKQIMDEMNKEDQP